MFRQKKFRFYNTAVLLLIVAGQCSLAQDSHNTTVSYDDNTSAGDEINSRDLDLTTSESVQVTTSAHSLSTDAIPGATESGKNDGTTSSQPTTDLASTAAGGIATSSRLTTHEGVMTTVVMTEHEITTVVKDSPPMTEATARAEASSAEETTSADLDSTASSVTVDVVTTELPSGSTEPSVRDGVITNSTEAETTGEMTTSSVAMVINANVSSTIGAEMDETTISMLEMNATLSELNTTMPAIESTPEGTSSSVVSDNTTEDAMTTESDVTTEQEVTTSKDFISTLPPVKNVTLEIVYFGDCQLVVGNAEMVKDFKTRVQNAVVKSLDITENHVHVSGLKCGSLSATVIVANVAQSEDIMPKINAGNLTIQIENQNETLTYTVSKVSKVTSAEPTERTSDPVKKNDDLTDVEMILIIVCGVVGGGMLLFALGACFTACHQRRMTKSFELGITPKTEADFTLTKMDRPRMVYESENPYTSAYDEENSKPDVHQMATLPLRSRRTTVAEQQAGGIDNPSYSGDDSGKNGTAGPTKQGGEGATAF